MSSRFEIAGRAGPEETAAIAAVITHLLDEEEAALATPPRAPRQSSWVLAWRPRDVPAPLPSHTYAAQPWAETAPSDQAEEFLG